MIRGEMSIIKAELLINKDSRRSNAAMPEIRAACEEHGIELVKIHHFGAGSDLLDTIALVKKRNPGILIVGSGDGTISDVVDHMAESSIEIGIIPLGTTNNFARSLGIPLDISGAVCVIKEAKARPVDLGRIGDEYFANVAGIGLSARIAGNVTDWQKKWLGRFAYAATGVKELLRNKPFLVTVEDKDSELKVHFETHQVIVANGRYHAGKEIARDARVDNRELIIFAIGGRSKLSFVRHMFDYYLGERKSIRHSSYLIGRDIKLSASTEQPVELDGEVKFTTPLRVQVQARAVKIRYTVDTRVC
jgi:YegS/Rv2252/BmrU family lipid kinase